MMAVERGMLDLDRPLADILPERRGMDLDSELGRRSLKDLLAHRSGMPAWISFYLDLMAHDDSTGSALAEADTADVDGWIEIRPGLWMDPVWCDTIHHRIRTTEPSEPGSYRYSDLGYYCCRTCSNPSGTSRWTSWRTASSAAARADPHRVSTAVGATRPTSPRRSWTRCSASSGFGARCTTRASMMGAWRAMRACSPTPTTWP